MTSLSKLKSDYSSWRFNKKSGDSIPAEIVALGKSLLEQYPVFQIYRETRIPKSTLYKWRCDTEVTEQSYQNEEEAPRFLSLNAPLDIDDETNSLCLNLVINKVLKASVSGDVSVISKLLCQLAKEVC